MTKLKETCERVLEAAEKATKVVQWYPHSNGESVSNEATVRGPFNRWFRVAEVQPQYKKHVANTFDDAKFAATAMNSAEKLARALLVMEEALESIEVIIERMAASYKNVDLSYETSMSAQRAVINKALAEAEKIMEDL